MNWENLSTFALKQFLGTIIDNCFKTAEFISIVDDIAPDVTIEEDDRKQVKEFIKIVEKFSQIKSLFSDTLLSYEKRINRY